MRTGVTGAAALVACGVRATLVVAMVVMVGGGCRRPRFVPPPPTVPPTVESVVAALGPRVRVHWAPYLRAAGLEYPPAELVLLAFKRERRLEIWGRADPAQAWARIDALPVLAASGVAGPKLREGDRQVPEGFYRLVAFNPNSRFHLSMMLDYPNADDLAAAAADGRTDLGSEIFIHGGARSIGCLAIGDVAIENLFVLVADVGIDRVEVIVAPHDPRGGIPLAPIAGLPFTGDLYRRLADRLAAFGPAPCSPQ